MVYNVFDRKSSGGAVTCAKKSSVKSEVIPNQQLSEELHKPHIEKRKVYTSLKIMFGVFILEKCNYLVNIVKYFVFLIRVIDIYSIKSISCSSERQEKYYNY